MSVQSKPNYQPICALLLCAAVAFTGCGREKPAHAAPPPEVQVIPVRRQDVPVVREWVATMDGAVNAQVRAQVTGYLLRQRYRNGEFVRKGAPLFDIDARPFQAVVNEAQANVEQSASRLAQAQSDLASAQAKLGKTRLDVARSRPLAQEKAISQQELDDAIQSDLAAQAAVSSAEAGIVAAKAAIEGAKAKLLSAQLNLNFATIVSPIDGIAGVNSAQIGDLVGPQSPALTTISTADPILVNFTLPEAEYLAVVNRLHSLGSSEAVALSKLEFQLQLADNSTYPHKGRIHAVDRQVDVKTGSILVQTEFPNPGNVLRPGGFGRVSTTAGVEHDALLVPQRAIADVQGVHLVAVVSKDGVIRLQRVILGAMSGRLRIVTQGLQSDDRVVAEGIQKVRDGMTVIAKPFVGGGYE